MEQMIWYQWLAYLAVSVTVLYSVSVLVRSFFPFNPYIRRYKYVKFTRVMAKENPRVILNSYNSLVKEAEDVFKKLDHTINRYFIYETRKHNSIILKEKGDVPNINKDNLSPVTVSLLINLIDSLKSTTEIYRAAGSFYRKLLTEREKFIKEYIK